MEPEHRRTGILAALAVAGRVTVNELADLLEVSRETIRRDLAELEEAGRLRKVHGGAVSAPPIQYEFGPESSFQVRMQEHAEAKRHIARTAAALLKPGDTVFIDTGSTTVVFAEEIAHKAGLTVITNSGIIAGLASRGEGARVIHLGGEYRADGAETVGPVTVEQIERYQATHAVLTIAGLTEFGGQDADPAEAEIARAMARRSGEVILLADSSKFCRGFPYTAVDLSRVTRLVANERPEARLADALHAAGVDVITG